MQLRTLKILLKNEISLEIRQKYALFGIILYVLSTCFISYFSFKTIQPLAWIALFWIITLFASINAIARSFMQYTPAQMRYYYTIAPPEAVVLSKIIYNALLNILLATLALLCFTLLIGNPITDNYTFFIALALGSTALSTILTMMSAIAHKANNNPTLMTILSLPAIIPTLSMTIKISKNALDGLQFIASYDEIIALISINIISIAVAYILFPYLWRT